jgi:hypothetical protein
MFLICSRWQMLRPKRLVDYPWVVVRIECVLCPRKGCYRLARLAARYGPEQSLDGLLADIARDCPWWRKNPRKYDPRCGARFGDLERNLPPPDDPDAPLYRRRQPGREDVPKPKRGSRPSWSGDLPMLSGWPGAMVVVACRRCPRRDTYVKADVLMNRGDVALGHLLKDLVSDCPRAGETRVYELCQAHFEISE